MRIGVLRETLPSERRVALVPDVVRALVGAGWEVAVEADAGAGAWFDDARYADAGAHVGAAADVAAAADVLVAVHRPPAAVLARGPANQVLVGLFHAVTDAAWAAEVAARGSTVFSLDGIPRTLSRAQSMDVLTSQSNIAGYKAAIVAAEQFARYFPMLTTAAGTAPPATVLVLGVGVAGLQAIGTARRLGAVVSAYDVRPEARADAESVGATFLDVSAVADGGATGTGYARALTADEQRAQQEQLAAHIARHDIVLTTAQVPGRRPPLLVSADVLAALRPGSVVVDLAAGPLGGNVEGVQDGVVQIVGQGVTLIGAGNLPASVPTAASTAYARNVAAFLGYVAPDGRLAVDPDDDVQRGCLVAHAGRVVHPSLAPAAPAPAVSSPTA